MADHITPGDVLLFHGDSFVSWAIRFFDGADVNHVAVAGAFLAAFGRQATAAAAPEALDLSTVLTTVADFVTPGDLLGCPSLFDIEILAGS